MKIRGVVKYLRIFVVAVTVVTLSACAPAPTPTPTPTQSQVVLVWWNLWEPEENVKPLIEAYQNLHPNVKIQYTQKGTNSLDEYRSELDTALGDQDPLTTPDIFTIHNTWTDKYNRFIGTAPTTVITPDDLNDFYPIIRNDFNRTNSQLAVPLYMDSVAIIYNKDLLQAGGYSLPSDKWSDFQVQARNLTKKDSQGKITQAGFSAYHSANSQFYFEMMNLLFLQNGVTMTDVTGQRAIFNSQAEATGAVNFYKSFTTGTPTWSKDMKKDVAAFLEGDLAMYAAPSWRLIDILNYNKAYSLNLNIGVTTVPQLSGAEEMYWPSYWGLTVAKESTQQSEAWQFIKFLTEKDQLKLLDSTVKANGRPIGIIYPRQSMSSEVSGDDKLSPYVIAITKAKNWNMKDGYAIQKLFDQAFAAESVNLQDLETKVTEVLQSTQ